MSGKSRHAASTSSPSHTPKLPKFLQSKQTRDRSKSMIDPSSGSSIASSSSSSSHILSDSQTTASSSTRKNNGYRSPTRRGSKLMGTQESRADQEATPDADMSEGASIVEDSMDEPPVIIEPISPRIRTRSERPLSSASENHVSYYQPSHSSTRLSDLPTRLSGWFQHAFNSSSTDLALPSLLSNSHLSTTTTSPKGKASALLTAAKHGRGHLDKAVRYLLDSDATPDDCPEVIWLLGVQHSGYEPPVSLTPSTPPPSGRRGSVGSRRSPSFRTSTSSTVTSPNAPADLSRSQSQSPSSKHPGHTWPAEFYSDFTSRIWLTYRSHFQPIRDSTLSALDYEQADPNSVGAVASSPQPKRWNWPGTGEKGWTSDSGWGCMLRTGQSLLANALLHLHLGRDWRRPPYAVHTSDYATYVQLLTWFFDSPSPSCPFSVHRMALAGKELGKDVGQWFGPSTAAGAIKTLVHAFPNASLGVSVAVDSQIFQTDVYTASHPATSYPKRGKTSAWGGRAVLVLIGIRLGLDGVNPIYYDTIKTLYTFPQSIGIAGGRPSSSYYFVGSQADNLFYLDPHHARPAVPLRPPPSLPDSAQVTPRDRFDRQTSPDSDRENKKQPPSSSHHYRSPTSPSSVRTGSSTFSYHAPYSPSPLAHQVSSSSSSSNAHARWHSTSIPSTPSHGGSEFSSGELREEPDSGLDPLQAHYVSAYSMADLKTFHCDRVRKMPMSGLDPSMLIGFLCKDESDWIDLRSRIADLSRTHKAIFSVHDEPPSWPSDSDDNMGLESMSEPDMDMDMPEEDGDFFDASEGRARPGSVSPDADALSGNGEAKSLPSEVDTEEDPLGPITPGPHSLSTFERVRSSEAQEESEFFADDADGDDDDWVDPSLPTPQPRSPAEPLTPARPRVRTDTSNDKLDNGRKGQHSRRSNAPVTQSPPPPAQDHFPFPTSQSESPEERKRIPQMSTARARDGGRTQSGGVRGVLTNNDGDDF